MAVVANHRSTISDAARKEGAIHDIVLGAIERLVQTAADWNEIKQLPVIGIDEIALKKGHRDFVVLVTARLENGELKLLGVLPDRKQETVEAFLLTIREKLRATLKEVCIDMWEGYANAARKALPQAKIIADRFHVAKSYRDCADQLRIEAQRDLKKSLEKDSYDGLKGTMWLFRRNPQDLKDEERESLELLFECAPDLKQAYDLRERLTSIFETHHTRESGRAAIRGWIQRVRNSKLHCFDPFLTTLGN
jgi:transposase